MTAHVCSAADPAALLAQIDALRGGAFRPTLAVVFCSPDWDAQALADALAARHLAVVGTSTAGEIAGAAITEGGCSVMLCDPAADAFALWSEPRADGETMRDVAVRLGAAAAARFEDPVVLAFASGVATTDGESVVQGVRAGAGGPVPLFGGLAADDLRMAETRVIGGDAVHADGLAALVLDGARYHAEGLATSGWQPVGVAKTVTRADGNAVFELDGESVLDVYGRYLDMGDLRGSGTSIAMDLGVQYPILVERADGTAVIRAPLMSDPETDALIFAGTVAEGASVRFCIPPSLDVVDRVIDEAGALRARAPDADAVLLISCKARHTALGPIVEDEVEGLAEVWDAPMAGYFSYGEFGGAHGGAEGPGRGESDFHNETCSLVAIREVPRAEGAPARG